MTSGRVSTSRSLSPFRSCGCAREALAAEVGFRQLVPLDHRPHRAVEDEDALREQAVECFRTSEHSSPLCTKTRNVFWVFVPSCLRGDGRLRSRRDQHRERIAGLARADADADVATVRRRSASSSARRRRIRAAGRRAWRAPSLPRCARRSSTSTRPPGAVIRAASATARAGCCGVVQRLREHRHVDRGVAHRQLLELALLPDDVRDAAAARQRARASARPRIDRRRSRATPSARLRS